MQCPHQSTLRCSPAGFSKNAADGTSQFLAATDDDDSIDLLFLHIAVDDAPTGSGCTSSRAVQSDAGTSSLQHTQRPTNLPADVVSDDNQDDWQCAGSSSAALHQWLDEVLRLLFQYPSFNSAVLTAILLKNHEAIDMLQVFPLTCHTLELQLCGAGNCGLLSMYCSTHSYKPQNEAEMLADPLYCKALYCAHHRHNARTYLSHGLQASSPGAVFEEEDFPRVVRPQQSRCISNMQTVRHSRGQSSLMIQHLPGVIR